MNKKNLLIKLTGITSIILITFLYLMFYLLPSIETINLRKRQLKDMKAKIETFKETQKTFPFPDAQEDMILKEAETVLRKRIPTVKNKEDLNSLLTRVSDYINKRARADGIVNLRITDNRRQVDVPGENTIRIHLTFPGPLKPVVNFIAHLPPGDNYIMPESIIATTVGNSISYSVDLTLYTGTGKGSTNGIPQREMVIDLQSPLLLKRVTGNAMGTYTPRQLPPACGTGILKTSSPVSL